jgi:hypothetical protein
MRIELMHKLLDLSNYIFEELNDEFDSSKDLGLEFFKYLKSKFFDDITQKIKVSDFIYEKILSIDDKEFNKKYHCNLTSCKKSKNQMMFVTSIVTQMLKYSNKNEIIDW